MYDAFSQDYDRFVNWAARLAVEMPFIESLLRQTFPQRQRLDILDAACGTGMHAIALARQGHTVSGADLSRGMIEQAQRNAAAAGAATTFALAGFGELSAAFGAHAFDALLCLGNSLPHLLDAASLSAALTDFHTCLRPGGLLLIQNRNFDAVLTHRQRWMEPQAHRQGEREWLFLRFYDFDTDGLLTFNIVTLQREQGGPWQQAVTATRLAPQPQDKLTRRLQAAGFVQITCFGGLDGTPFDPPTSPNLVVTARTSLT